MQGNTGLIPQCPHCGSHLTYINCRAYGWIQLHYDEEGLLQETLSDGLRSTVSKTVRCADCGAIRRDLELQETTIKAKVESKI